MNTLTKRYFDSLVSPACIINRDFIIQKTNEEFLLLADISKGYIDKGISLHNCIDISILDERSDEYLDNVFSGKKCIMRRYTKARNSKGIPLSLLVSILPDATHRSFYATLLLSNLTEDKDIQRKYNHLFEKEKEEQQNIVNLNSQIHNVKQVNTTSASMSKNFYSAYNNDPVLSGDELELAKNVQRGLLPNLSQTYHNLCTSSVYIPVKKVGGDMYDLIKLSHNKFAVFIYDVAGHGVPSALIAVMAKIFFTNHVKNNCSPSEIFTAINMDICKYLQTGHYLTAFLGIIDTSNHTMTYSQAGHVSPILYKNSTGETSFFSGSSFIIGHSSLSEVVTYHDFTIPFKWNDKILLYTDGLTESTNRNQELYGKKRLLKVVEQHCKKNPETLIKEIIEDNVIFRGTHPLQDDVTMFCIQIGCTDEILEKSGFNKFDYPEMLTLHTHNEIENICSVILSNLDKKGYMNSDIFKTHQSIHEILSNAIQHGNKFNSEKKVLVFYKILLDSFMISVVDEGNGFNYSKLPKILSPSKKKKVNGKGLYIVKQFMDEIKFNDKGNRILIAKHQKQEA